MRREAEHQVASPSETVFGTVWRDDFDPACLTSYLSDIGL
jgi:hypothetical protein